MIRRIVYGDGDRYAEIDWMDERMWRVFVREGLRATEVWRRSLTSAQSTARQFIQSGRFPR